MPLCEELGYIPTEKYAHQPELWRHSRLIADRYGLWEKICLSTQVTGMEWEEDVGMWAITSSAGDAFRAGRRRSPDCCSNSVLIFFHNVVLMIETFVGE